MAAPSAPRHASFGGTARALIGASHPEPAVGVTAMAVALALATGRRAPGVLAVGAAVATGQLFVGWHNDWLDAERDRRNGRSDKPVARGEVARSAVGRAAVVAGLAVVPLSLLSGWRAGLAHVIAVASAGAYNASLKATVVSWLPYTVSFPLLVVFVWLGLPGSPLPPWWAPATAALLGAGAHLANAAPDLADDVATGVLGLPQRLGYGRSVALAVGLLLAGTVLETLAPGPPPAWAWVGLAGAGAVAAGGVVGGRRPGSRWLFRAAMGVALVDVAVLVARIGGAS